MFDFTIMLLSILGGVHSFLNGVREKRYEASCRQLMAECLAAVLAGFIGMCFAEYKGMDESLQNCVTIICSINNRLILEKLQRIIDSYLNRNAS
ncbi:phage holin family protein [Escherichia coli]|uniref:phage holin family protein n=1 Tax=Escherichia coli TaxID=562 RepID=UPI0007A63B5E|nr:phage holin family protein [Escherichia coli]MCK3261316.1 phage holin family protein [Escherichia coli]MCK3276489.1 phage holin family protein [Escherichia coli]